MTMGLDGFTGAILAVESVVDAAAILHGPLGCKYFQSSMSDTHYTRSGSQDASELGELGFFMQARVPCDFLDVHDYINGGSDKLETVLPIIASRREGLLAIINSPGAALIGDDVAQSVDRLGLSHRTVLIDNPCCSCPASKGFEEGIIAVLDAVRPPQRYRRKRTVNLLGLSIMHKNWEGTVKELRRLLSLMGIETIATIGAGCTIEEMRASSEAELNIILCPEYGQRTAEWYAKTFGTPYLISPRGAPVGFDATEAWLLAVAHELGVDPSPAIADLTSAKSRARMALEKFNLYTGLPRGATFSIRADSSIAYPLTKWLVTYLGMWPEAIELLPGSDKKMDGELRSFITRFDGDVALDRKVCEEHVDVVFANGNEISFLLSNGMCSVGMAITISDQRRAELIPRTYWGTSGALQILENIINGL
ncbi:MAG: nitrogenase [Euryarchaeota archaeon]|nr:nitrogenase [Euryarchaeota archaeon]